MKLQYTDTKYFGGLVTVFQPKEGYRAGTDSVLLAASLMMVRGETCLELGVGSGIVTLLAAHQNPNAQFTGLECSVDMLDLARKNAQNNENVDIAQGTIRALPKAWHLKFDQVFCNPPYFDSRKSVRMPAAKAPSFVNKKALGVEDWVGAMLLMLKPRGIGTLIYRADGLEKVLAALSGKAGRLKILPVQPFKDQPAGRVIIQFRKGVKSETTLLPALVLHEKGSGEKFTPRATQIINGDKRLKL